MYKVSLLNSRIVNLQNSHNLFAVVNLLYVQQFLSLRDEWFSLKSRKALALHCNVTLRNWLTAQ